MKNRLLGVFLVVTVILQLAFPSYFLFEALERENKTYERGTEYTLKFDEIDFFYESDGYRFNYQDNYCVENPDSGSDDLWDYYTFAVAKGENGETLFFDPDKLSREQLQTMDVFPSPYGKIVLDFENCEFCGSIKNEEEFYNFLIESLMELYSEDEDVNIDSFPSFEDYKSGKYMDSMYWDQYMLLGYAPVEGTLTVKISDGELIVTELYLGDELILKLK